MVFNDDVLERHLPQYLTHEDRGRLRSDLRAISHGGTAPLVLGASGRAFAGEMLQGDGWRGLELYDRNRGRTYRVQGFILSNSCDVDPANRRAFPTRLVFSPLVRLSAYVHQLKSLGLAESGIDSRVRAIKAQRVHSMFFLPAGGQLKDDTVVRFDDIHSMPMSLLTEADQATKLFTLSQAGFYMLALKLSMHFCRLHEGVRRQ